MTDRPTMLEGLRVLDCSRIVLSRSRSFFCLFAESVDTVSATSAFLTGRARASRAKSSLWPGAASSMGAVR